MSNKKDTSLLDWSTGEIARLLKLPTEDAKGVASYVLSFADEASVRNYLRDVLGTNSTFTDDLIERKFHPAPTKTQAQPVKEQTPPSKPASANQPQGGGRGKGRQQPQQTLTSLPPTRAREPEVIAGAKIFEKEDIKDDFWGSATAKKGAKKGKGKTSGKEYEQYVDPNAVAKPYTVFQTPILVEKKKGKPGVVEEKKRLLCGCQGTIHPYVNNCLNCGRIACEVEGDGSCFHCGEIIEWHPPSEDGVTTQLPNGAFGRRGAPTKTLLYDDQADYYNVNDTWLSPEEKKKLREREQKRIQDMEDNKKKFTFDFAGRKILSTKDEDAAFAEEMKREFEAQNEERPHYVTDFRKRLRENTTADQMLSMQERRKRRAFLEEAMLSTTTKRVQHELFPTTEEEQADLLEQMKQEQARRREEEAREEERKLKEAAEAPKPQPTPPKEVSTPEQQPKPQRKQKEQACLPPGLTYKPNFITMAEEGSLLTLIDGQGWDTSLQRRTQQYGYKYDYSAAYSNDTKTKRAPSRVTQTTPIPSWLNKYCEKLVAEGYFKQKPDQIIINEYKPGQGIAPHKDHESFGDQIASLSLLSPIMMEFKAFEKDTPVQRGVGVTRDSVYLQPRSLLVLEGEVRNDWSHAIDATVTDTVNGQKVIRKRRVAITFRTVKK